MPHAIPDLEARHEEGPHIAGGLIRAHGYTAESERTFFLASPDDTLKQAFADMSELLVLRKGHGHFMVAVVYCRENFGVRAVKEDVANGQGKPYGAFGFGAQIAQVEVDMELGRVKVLGVVAAHDVGRAINTVQLEGQIHGGVAQGLGYALMEEFVPVGLCVGMMPTYLPIVIK